MPVISDVYEIRGVCHISCDGREELALDKGTFKKLKLSLGDSIDIEEIIEKAAEIQAPRAYESALSMLDKSAKTASQIKTALVRRGYLEDVADKCVIRLLNAKLINDADYAKRLVQSRGSKPVSRFMLKQKMIAKGLGSSDIEKALEDVTDEEQKLALRQLSEKLNRRYEDLDPREGRQKLSMALARRGFGWDDVKAAVGEIYDGDDDD